MLKFSGFYNAKFDPEDVQFAFAPESSLFNPKSLREACGNEPLCGVPKKWFKSCWAKHDAWVQCKATWQASQAAQQRDDVTTYAPPTPIEPTPTPSGGGGTGGEQPEPEPEKREQKTNVWLWVSAILGFLIFIFIVIFLIKQFNK